MIPLLNEMGVLPSGKHECSLEEIKERYTSNDLRAELFEGLLRFIKELKSKVPLCSILYIDGSFITSKIDPGDVDVLWDVDDFSPDYELFERNMPILYQNEECKKLYSCDPYPARMIEGRSGIQFLSFFQKVKHEDDTPKGILKIRI